MIPPAAAKAARPWQPGIAIRISFGVHLACLAAVIIRLGWWPWALAVVVANHLVLALIGLWPRSRTLGANMLRLPDAAIRRHEIALTFDDGPDPEITPKVLDLLDRHQAKASFFCVGERAAAYPDVIREIARRGHSVENHSQRHSGFFGFLFFGGLRREIGAAQTAIAALAGRPPAFFRSPMGIRNPFLDPVVAQLGLTYISWTRRGFDTVAKDPQAVLQRLTHGLAAGDILLLHDRRTGPADPPVLEVLPLLLQNIAAAGLKPVSLPMAMR
ncbi:MAG TPA: polysaccharide deacetylase family protein [Burkholderiales bacterium]|nr:polysaccharide deacetylase family protein [Burkholderiales bacterium]